MKRIVAAVCVLCASASMAQEIGKEIPAGQTSQTPASSETPNYDNPYATPPPPPPVPEKKADEKQESAVPGPRKMAFGINAGFGGSGIPSVGGGAPGAGGPVAPTLGFRLVAAEQVALNFNLGLGLGFVNSNALMGFGLGFGVDAFLGRKDVPVRPFVTGSVAFGKGISRTDATDFSLGFNVGGGGEYWFNDHFSVNARALIGVPIDLDSGVVTIATFVPGLGGTVYF